MSGLCGSWCGETHLRGRKRQQERHVAAARHVGEAHSLIGRLEHPPCRLQHLPNETDAFNLPGFQALKAQEHTLRKTLTRWPDASDAVMPQHLPNQELTIPLNPSSISTPYFIRTLSTSNHLFGSLITCGIECTAVNMPGANWSKLNPARLPKSRELFETLGKSNRNNQPITRCDHVISPMM